MRRVLIPQNLQELPQQLPAGEQKTLSGQTMGTTWTVRYVHTLELSLELSDDGVRALIEHELDLVVAQMSTWQNDSDLSFFNQANANTWHVLPAPLFTVLDCALKIAAETHGAFDPTIGPLVNLWGFGPNGGRTYPPDLAEVKVLHVDCGWQKLQLDHESKSALQPGNLYVDLSGIAKGYSVDRIARAMKDAGIENFLVEVGGELYGTGLKPDAQPWWVALETSPVAQNLAESVVALHGLAVATSGDYRRYFEHDGSHYAHTINPRTGFPIDRAINSLVSVTVIHAECMVADALATAFIVMGVDSALAFATGKNIAVLLIEQKADGIEEHLSPKLMAMLE